MAEGVLILAAGLGIGLLGYRLFHAALGIYGFVLGASVAFLVVAPIASPGLGLLAAIVAGILGAVAVTPFEEAAFVLPGAAIGLVVGLAVGAFAGLGALSALLGALFAGAGGLVGWKAERLAISAGTAFVGAWFVVSGAGALLPGGAAPFALPDLGPRGVAEIGVVALAIAFAAVQLRHPRPSPPRAR